MLRFGLTGLSVAATLLSAPVLAQNRQPAQPAPRPPVSSRPAAPVVQPGQQAQRSPIPQAAGLIVLIKSTLVALNQANSTGNYSVLWALASDKFRASNNQQGLAQGFAGFRSARVDLSPVIYLNPQLTRPPAIEGGRLHLVGSFPSRPAQINFDLFFEPSQGIWKLAQINASLAPVR